MAFSSDATNLVAGDTNDTEDILVHDRHTGTTTRVSVDSAGTQANIARTSARPEGYPNKARNTPDVLDRERISHQQRSARTW